VCRTHDMASSLTRISAELALAWALAGRLPGAVGMVERAVQEALRLLEQNPVLRVPRPAPIDRVSKP